MSKKVADDLRLLRRRRVAQLRERGFSIDAIYQACLKDPRIRSANGKVWGRSTIGDDVKLIRQQWSEELRSTNNTLQAEQLNKIRLVQQQAATSEDWTLFLKAVGDEIKLTGTSASLQAEITIVSRLVRAIESVGQDSSSVLEKMIRHLESKARSGEIVH